MLSINMWVKQDDISDKMADRLTNLCMGALNAKVADIYEVCLITTEQSDNNNDYMTLSRTITETTVMLQKILDNLFENPRLIQSVKNSLEALEEKLENVALQNIVNEQLLGRGALYFNNPEDRKFLKSLILNKLK